MAAILHKVKRGETIMSICLVYGLDYDKFIGLNDRFLGEDYRYHQLQAGDYTVVGDSADPLDLVRVLARKGKL